MARPIDKRLNRWYASIVMQTPKMKIVSIPMKSHLAALRRGVRVSVQLECGHWDTCNRTEIRKGWCYCFKKECRGGKSSQ